MDNNFNNNYNNNYNYYNPVPAPNMNGNIKKRNSGAVALSILLGFFILFFITTLSLRLGLFHGNDLSESIKNSGVIELFQDELLNEMGKDVEYYHGEQEILNDSVSKLADYYIDAVLNGKVPSKDIVEKDLTNLYDDICEVMATEIVDEISEKGSVPTNKLSELDAITTTRGIVSDYEMDAFEQSIASELGDIISITKDNKNQYKKLFTNSLIENRQNISGVVDDIYSSLLELAQDVGSEQSVQTTVSIVYHSFAISVLVSAVVLGLLVIGCIVAIALIDKDAKLTVKGLFAPFFVPGIIIFIISLAIKIGSIVLMNGYNSMDDVDKKLVTLFDQLAKVIINPFVIISGIVLVLGIVFLIVGKCMKNDNSGATL